MLHIGQATGPAVKQRVNDNEKDDECSSEDDRSCKRRSTGAIGNIIHRERRPSNNNGDNHTRSGFSSMTRVHRQIRVVSFVETMATSQTSAGAAAVMQSPTVKSKANALNSRAKDTSNVTRMENIERLANEKRNAPSDIIGSGLVSTIENRRHVPVESDVNVDHDDEGR
jgi:hypothetical protein